MSQSNRQHDALLELLGQLCDGTLDAEGWTRLEALLLADRDARAVYRHFLNLHIGLKQYHVVCPKSTAAPARSPILGFLSSRLQQGWDYCTKTTPFSILVAVGFPLMCILILGIYVIGTRVGPRDGREGPVYVAQLSRALDCTWTTETQPPVSGESLAVGRRLLLEKGLAELAMNNGTKVILEGPVTVDLVSADRVRLRQGRLAANVPKQAIGFAVQTPNTVVVDLGTEFGVAVSPEGVSEVQVFTGQVEMSVIPAGASDTPDGAGEKRRLQAGQAGRVDRGDARIDLFVADASTTRFTRALPTSRQCHFQQGGPGAYAGAKDTYICSARRGEGNGIFPGLKKDEPDTSGRNFGHQTQLFTSHKTGQDGLQPEVCRSLIRFDDVFGDAPGQVPRGAKILSAVLLIHVGTEAIAPGPDENRLCEVLVPWEEDTVTWASFGAGGRPGAEYAPQAVARFVPERANAFHELNVTQSLQRWSTGAANHGWILLGNGWDRAHFDSSDAASVGSRPQLIVEYQLEKDAPKKQQKK